MAVIVQKVFSLNSPQPSLPPVDTEIVGSLILPTATTYETSVATTLSAVRQLPTNLTYFYQTPTSFGPPDESQIGAFSLVIVVSFVIAVLVVIIWILARALASTVEFMVGYMTGYIGEERRMAGPSGLDLEGGLYKSHGQAGFSSGKLAFMLLGDRKFGGEGLASAVELDGVEIVGGSGDGARDNVARRRSAE